MSQRRRLNQEFRSEQRTSESQRAQNRTRNTRETTRQTSENSPRHERILQQAVAVASALTLAQQNHNNRRLDRAQQLHSTAANLRVQSRRAIPIPNQINPSIHPQFRSKIVVEITCSHCSLPLCSRGMKAILLGNTRVELYSTDTPPGGVGIVFGDYTTSNCGCRIRDGACLCCGNVVGYHVTQPCDGCLEACNNGHFWMFHADGVNSRDRMDTSGTKSLRWAMLGSAEEGGVEGMDVCLEGGEVEGMLCR
jgi:hypothetical protein